MCWFIGVVPPVVVFLKNVNERPRRRLSPRRSLRFCLLYPSTLWAAADRADVDNYKVFSSTCQLREMSASISSLSLSLSPSLPPHASQTLLVEPQYRRP